MKYAHHRHLRVSPELWRVGPQSTHSTWPELEEAANGHLKGPVELRSSLNRKKEVKPQGRKEEREYGLFRACLRSVRLNHKRAGGAARGPSVRQ